MSSRAIDQLYDWLRSNDGHPCLVMPTGAGKSHIVATLCHEGLQNWPETRVLMLTHQKELIEQNAAKMREHWPGAPLGIYSASIGKRQLGEPITFAGIQSVRSKAHLLGHVDLVIIDECHLVSHKDEGGYRTLLNALLAINPALRVIGLTATPYRLGHGLITDKPALFDGLIDPVTIEELVYKGFLTTLRSKVTKARFDLDGVHKRGGEFIESELQAAVDTDDNNAAVVAEIMELGADRRHWLLFCTGVDHAQHIAACVQHARDVAGRPIDALGVTESNAAFALKPIERLTVSEIIAIVMRNGNSDLFTG
jgi:DNA repair protein RadD